ncbi:MAG: amino acid ABC transporter permease [Bilophila sp.]
MTFWGTPFFAGRLHDLKRSGWWGRPGRSTGFWGGVLLVLLGLGWLVYRLMTGDFAYNWQWYRVWRYLGVWKEGGFTQGPLLEGLVVTGRIAAAGLVCAVFAGVSAALLRLSPWPVGRGVAHVYIGCIRNTPLLLQLFVVYFLVSPVFGLGPFGSAVLALGAFEGAYMAELFRAGLLAVPRSQWEAGISLGLGIPATLRLVMLPQAVRAMLPPLTSQLVSLIKDTSLVSAIAVGDLTMRAQEIIADSFLAFEVWLVVAGLYLLLTLCVAVPARWLEQRYRW